MIGGGRRRRGRGRYKMRVPVAPQAVGLSERRGRGAPGSRLSRGWRGRERRAAWGAGQAAAPLHLPHGARSRLRAITVGRQPRRTPEKKRPWRRWRRPQPCCAM